MTAPVPSVPELFVPVMKAMETLGGSASIEEINDRVAQVMGLPESTRAGLHGNGPTDDQIRSPVRMDQKLAEECRPHRL